MQPEKQESTWIYEAWAWAELHRRQLVLGAVGVLLLIVGGYVFFWYRGQHELQANHALLTLTPAGRAEEKSGPGHDAFEQLATRYGSSRAAVRALLLAAGELYQAGKYAEARARFEEVVARDDTGLLAPMAALGAATCLDAEDKLDAAMAAYQQVIAKYPDDPVSGRARLALAALHEARGQFAEALKIYDSLQADRAAGRAAMEASVKRDSLLKQHPELAPATAPATPPVITPMGAGAPPATAAPATPPDPSTNAATPPAAPAPTP
jgi:predicted negative regulator of RcsB-dependent stress response